MRDTTTIPFRSMRLRHGHEAGDISGAYADVFVNGDKIVKMYLQLDRSVKDI